MSQLSVLMVAMSGIMYDRSLFGAKEPREIQSEQSKQAAITKADAKRQRKLNQRKKLDINKWINT